MVPPYSDRVSRAPPYSSSSSWPFHILGYHRLWPTFPGRFTKTTITSGLVPVRSSLLGESRLISFPTVNEIFQFTAFASSTYVFSAGYLQRGGFPHSDISGSMSVADSPELFAGCHVLHRL